MTKRLLRRRFCFARALLPYGTVGEANAHCTHLQIPQADPQTKICKRVQFNPSLIDLYRNGIHGIEHAHRVLLLVQELSIQEGLNQEHKKILEFCAMFHDIGRINDDIDDFHGIRSIKKLMKLNHLGLRYFDKTIVKYIIENHCISDNIAFDKVFNYNMVNNEEAIFLLKLFKDADNLDRIRLGDLDESFLRLKSSKMLVPFAKKLYTESLSKTKIENEFSQFIMNFKYRSNFKQ